MTDVQGFCPMGCGQTLFLGEGGYITCRKLACPRPDAVARLLEERESEHVIQFDDTGFTIMHPLRERLGELYRCELHLHCTSLDGPPGQVGRYRARQVHVDGPPEWTFERIGDLTP